MNYILKEVENNLILARGGGGGSSSSSSGGGGHSSSSSSSSHYSSSSGGTGSGADLPWWGTTLIIFLSFVLPIIIIILIAKFGKKVSSGSISGPPAGYIDLTKNGNEKEQELTQSGKDIFLSFQKAWVDFDLKAMKKITSPDYYKKMVLELNVLQNYGRQNIMDNITIQKAYILKSSDYSGGFNIYFVASANDKLIDTKENKTIFTDNSTFSEIWTFEKSGKNYVLGSITQTTAEASKFEPSIAEFAKTNNLYYDPDFGWLMMPSRGAIFGPAGFGNADINNHVIGYHKEIIVEFYSYEPKAGVGMKPFVVAQAILPKSYDDILVTEKSWYGFKPKAKGLNKIETESVEFNKKFAVWAGNADQATSFELLATNFMERIYALSFEINIEVVDNVLYLYSPDTNIAYSDMLEVLTWAFKEMKM